MKNIIFLIALGIIIYVAVKFYFSSLTKPQIQSPRISINNHSFILEVADTDAKRAQGLSDRLTLDQSHGMLFVFPTKDRYAFWMKDMHFPLDFIWIEDDLIVDITENVPTPVTATYLPRYQPKSQVNKVLEINMGVVKKNGIIIGQKVSFSGFYIH